MSLKLFELVILANMLGSKLSIKMFGAQKVPQVEATEVEENTIGHNRPFANLKTMLAEKKGAG